MSNEIYNEYTHSHDVRNFPKYDFLDKVNFQNNALIYNVFFTPK